VTVPGAAPMVVPVPSAEPSPGAPAVARPMRAAVVTHVPKGPISGAPLS
jgi:hypothetical protein